MEGVGVPSLRHCTSLAFIGRIMFRNRHMVIVTPLLTPGGTPFVAVSPVTVPFSLLSSSAPGTAISPFLKCTIPRALTVISARNCVNEREDAFPPSDIVAADRLRLYWEQNQDESTGGVMSQTRLARHVSLV